MIRAVYRDNVRLLAWICTAAAVVSVGSHASAPDPLLGRMAAYVDGFEKALSGVVAEEHYEQSVTPRIRGMAGGQLRRLRSDVLWTRVGESGWLAFRDVYDVDGRQVRDRDDRLMRLFLTPPPDLQVQAQRIIAASAEYNIGQIVRSLNVPTIGLVFLRTDSLTRSTFTVGGREHPEGLRGEDLRVIRFRERTRPRLIASDDGAAASGRVWVEERSGRVARTEVRLDSGRLTAMVTTTYGPVDEAGEWLPISMTEQYLSPAQRTDGKAEYSNVRRFTVSSRVIAR
jgi:hypothetical protein